MKSKDKLRAFLVLLVIFTAYFQLFIPNIKGIEKEVSISTVAYKDTYIEFSISNFGGQNSLLIGYPFYEAYLHFNFSDKPWTFTKAEISLDFWGVSQTMNFTVSLINDSWEEYSMTYSNKPTKRDKIGNLLVTGDGIYTIDVTNFIENLSSISICVYIDDENHVVDYAYITSREGYYSWEPEDAPKLIWTYLDDVTITITSPSSSSKWEGLDTYTIRWTTSTNTISNVKIELYKGSTYIEEISSDTTNDGSYDYYEYFSDDYKGTNYRIKISDYDDPQVYDFSDYFSINYEEEPVSPINPINPINPIYIGIGIGIVLVLGVVIFLLGVSHRRKTLKSTPIYMQQQVPHPAVQQIPIQPNENLKFCAYCGQTNNIKNQFCEDCGKKMVI